MKLWRKILIAVVVILLLFPSILLSVFCGQIVIVNNVIPFNKAQCSYPDESLQQTYDYLQRELEHLGAFSIKDLMQAYQPQQFRMTNTGFYTLIPSRGGKMANPVF